MSGQKVKVSVAKLLAKVEEYALADEALYAQQVEQHKHDVTMWQIKAASNVFDEHGKLTGSSYEKLVERYGLYGGFSRPQLNLGEPFPPAPRKPGHAQALATLRLAAEDTITLSVDDRQFGQYLR